MTAKSALAATRLATWNTSYVDGAVYVTVHNLSVAVESNNLPLSRQGKAMSDVTDGLRQLHATLKRIELNRCFQAIDEIERLAAKEEYALNHLEQALTIEKELRADVASRDDLLNEMCNVLQIISDGRNAAGSKIDRALYAETAHECLNDEWERVSTGQTQE